MSTPASSGDTKDPLLTPKELELDPEIRIPQKTSSNWRTRGIGPAFLQIGRRVLYKRSDVIAWLNSRRTTDADEARRLRRFEASAA